MKWLDAQWSRQVHCLQNFKIKLVYLCYRSARYCVDVSRGLRPGYIQVRGCTALSVLCLCATLSLPLDLAALASGSGSTTVRPFLLCTLIELLTSVGCSLKPTNRHMVHKCYSWYAAARRYHWPADAYLFRQPHVCRVYQPELRDRFCHWSVHAFTWL